MNLLGKIFIMLIFVMSIVFMSLSLMVFATHKNWKEAALGDGKSKIGLKQELEKVKLEIQQKVDEMNRLKTQYASEQIARAYALAALQSKLTQYEEQLKGKEEELRASLGSLTESLASLKTSAATQEALQTDVVALRENIRIAQLDRDKLFEQTVVLLDKSHAALDTERTLKERQEQLTQQVATQAYLLKKVPNDVLTSIMTSAPPPQLDGVVLAVNSNNLVEISLGSDDGLKEGHMMEVFRDSVYLGKVMIMKVTPNRAVGKVVAEYKRGPIRKDDRVATKLIKLG